MKFFIFSKTKKMLSFLQFQSRNWLVNELMFTFSAPIKYTKAQFNPICLSRVLEYTTYYRQTDGQTYRQTLFVKTGFSDSGVLKT